MMRIHDNACIQCIKIKIHDHACDFGGVPCGKILLDELLCWRSPVENRSFHDLHVGYCPESNMLRGFDRFFFFCFYLLGHSTLQDDDLSDLSGFQDIIISSSYASCP